MIGRYLDSLSDTHRDRVITGQGWGEGVFVSAWGEHDRCLLGHVEGWRWKDDVGADCTDYSEQWRREDWEARAGLRPNAIGYRFDALSKRFGLERTVRAVKARAGRRTHVVTEPIREVQEATV